MRIEEIRDQCTGCMACLNNCPRNCISEIVEEEGFYYPRVDHDKCIGCNSCDKVCHVLNPDVMPEFRRSFYGASRDEKVLQASTSGGAFFHLANEVINAGGKVYGAAFDLTERRLIHREASEVGLQALMKSKYVESDMGDTIRRIQKDVDAGKQVLFCGTPCEAAGVRKSVCDPQGLLLTVDFVCHGVPASKLLQEHLQDILGNSRLLEIDFRPKDKGWSSKNIRLRTRTRTRTTPYFIDLFYSGFMSHNAFLRRACYNCAYRTQHHSDVTIADFWGYRELNPEMEVEKGMSMIIANTSRGLKSVKQIEDVFDIHEMDNKYSDYAFRPKDYSAALEKRIDFYTFYQRAGFKYAAAHTYGKGMLIKKLKYRIKRILGRY